MGPPGSRRMPLATVKPRWLLCFLSWKLETRFCADGPLSDKTLNLLRKRYSPKAATPDEMAVVAWLTKCVAFKCRVAFRSVGNVPRSTSSSSAPCRRISPRRTVAEKNCSSHNCCKGIGSQWLAFDSVNHYESLIILFGLWHVITGSPKHSLKSMNWSSIWSPSTGDHRRAIWHEGDWDGLQNVWRSDRRSCDFWWQCLRQRFCRWRAQGSHFEHENPLSTADGRHKQYEFLPILSQLMSSYAEDLL